VCPVAILTLLALPLVSQSIRAGAQAPPVPPTRQDNFRETIHGVEIIDPYRWLEDQDSPETRQWIDAQKPLQPFHAGVSAVASRHSEAPDRASACRLDGFALRARRPLLPVQETRRG